MNGDCLTVMSGFDRDGRMQVIWDSNNKHVADVWSWDVTLLRLARPAVTP